MRENSLSSPERSHQIRGVRARKAAEGSVGGWEYGTVDLFVYGAREVEQIHINRQSMIASLITVPEWCPCLKCPFEWMQNTEMHAVVDVLKEKWGFRFSDQDLGWMLTGSASHKALMLVPKCSLQILVVLRYLADQSVINA